MALRRKRQRSKAAVWGDRKIEVNKSRRTTGTNKCFYTASNLCAACLFVSSACFESLLYRRVTAASTCWMRSCAGVCTLPCMHINVHGFTCRRLWCVSVYRKKNNVEVRFGQGEGQNNEKYKKRGEEWSDRWEWGPLDGTVVWRIWFLHPLSPLSPFSRSLFLSHVVSSSLHFSYLVPCSVFPPPRLSVRSTYDGASYTAGNWTHRTVVFPESKLDAWETQKAYPRTVCVCLVDCHPYANRHTNTGAPVRACKLLHPWTFVKNETHKKPVTHVWKIWAGLFSWQQKGERPRTMSA